MEDCIFCKIVNGEIPSIKVYEDERVYAFADINPISDGHTLIIPKAHAENLWEMSENNIVAVVQASQKIAAAMKEVFGPVGIAVLQLNGKVVNQVVLHYHMHMIPKAANGPRLKMTEWELVPGDMDKIKSICEKLSAAI